MNKEQVNVQVVLPNHPITAKVLEKAVDELYDGDLELCLYEGCRRLHERIYSIGGKLGFQPFAITAEGPVLLGPKSAVDELSDNMPEWAILGGINIELD